MNYDRIYKYRFQDVDAHKKQFTWQQIASYIDRRLHHPEKVLDPAAGNCEFINNVPSGERWAIDMNPATSTTAEKNVKVIVGNTLEVPLPANYFNGIFVSNFLEHLDSQHQVALFLHRMYEALAPGGRIAVIGPNFKYCYKEYFDFADHTVVLSNLGVAEHLYGAGFTLESVHPKFLPLSFRGRIPVTKFLVKTYLNNPVFWSFFGKQFLVVAQKK